MKFLTVRQLRNQPGKIWDEVQESEMVVTANGKPVALLMGVDEARLEETLSLMSRLRAQTALSRLREKARTEGLDTLSDNTINDEIKVVRKQRARRRRARP